MRQLHTTLCISLYLQAKWQCHRAARLTEIDGLPQSPTAIVFGLYALNLRN
jgi:hypothetical protein